MKEAGVFSCFLIALMRTKKEIFWFFPAKSRIDLQSHWCLTSTRGLWLWGPATEGCQPTKALQAGYHGPRAHEVSWQWKRLKWWECVKMWWGNLFFFFRNFRAIYRQFNMLFKEFFRISRFQPKSPKLSSQGNDPSSRSLSKAEPSLYHVQRPPCGTWWCEKWKGSKDRKSWIGNGEWMSPYQIWWALLYLTS